MPSQDDIRAAAARIGPHIRRTPLLRLPGPGGRSLVLKLELLQVTGSFKPRGAFNRLLASKVPAAGVVAASGGNHGIAVAHAASTLGMPAEIFVPEIAAAAKRERIAATGVRLVVGGANYEEARQASEARAAETGALLVHAYDQAEVLAGQGTIGLELQAEAPDLTHLMVAVGGGGLLGGIVASYAGRIGIVAVEPEECPTLFAATMTGEPVTVQPGGIAADSLGASRIGNLCLDAVSTYPVTGALVQDEAIRFAQHWLWDNCRIVAEPGGACALAALLTGAWQAPEGATIGALVCGGNCDPATGPWTSPAAVGA